MGSVCINAHVSIVKSLVIFYIVNILKNERIKNEQKALWANILVYIYGEGKRGGGR